jgi:SAM-dependent methyltransferase
MSLYRVLDHPLVYTAAQNIFAPGATTGLTRYIADMLDVLPDSDSLLDVGCGPQSWLSRLGKQPAGVDIEPAYVDAYIRNGGKARLGSADELPYTEGSFFGLWCIGVLHHLPDETVMAAIRGEAPARRRDPPHRPRQAYAEGGAPARAARPLWPLDL